MKHRRQWISCIITIMSYARSLFRLSVVFFSNTTSLSAQNEDNCYLNFGLTVVARVESTRATTDRMCWTRCCEDLWWDHFKALCSFPWERFSRNLPRISNLFDLNHFLKYESPAVACTLLRSRLVMVHSHTRCAALGWARDSCCQWQKLGWDGLRW